MWARSSVVRLSFEHSLFRGGDRCGDYDGVVLHFHWTRCWLGCQDHLPWAAVGVVLGVVVVVVDVVDVALAVVVDRFRTDAAGGTAENSDSRYALLGSCRGAALRVTHPEVQGWYRLKSTLHEVFDSRPRVLECIGVPHRAFPEC